MWDVVLAEQRRDFAERFDRIHSIDRAVEMGSVRSVIELASLRSSLIEAVERGIRRVERSARGEAGSYGLDGPVVMDEHAAAVVAQQPAAGGST